MGVEGTMEYISEFLKKRKRKKKKQMQTVALRVARIDCEGCERRIKHILSSVKGVKSVDVDVKLQKVTVMGYVDPKKVLEAAKSTKKKVELWPYVPYTMVANPYISQAYDKKAPPNMVRKVPDTASVNETTVDDSYTIMFSDENPNSCFIM
uniref:Heavy metal-associated isoprenylated plant protein 26 n=2 Tax=Noccaea caerulescens TaxID=107243 RepID=A0A1J3E1Z4_NOCCA